MALDKMAGQKRSIGISRNLMVEPAVQTVAPVISTSPEIVEKATNQIVIERSPSVISQSSEKPSGVGAYANAGVVLNSSKPLQAKPQSNRNHKISFMTDSDLQARFRKARLVGGFEKLEDAYNEALKIFCEKFEK